MRWICERHLQVCSRPIPQPRTNTTARKQKNCRYHDMMAQLWYDDVCEWQTFDFPYCWERLSRCRSLSPRTKVRSRLWSNTDSRRTVKVLYQPTPSTMKFSSTLSLLSLVGTTNAFVNNQVLRSTSTELYARKPFITGNWKLNPQTKVRRQHFVSRSPDLCLIED